MDYRPGVNTFAEEITGVFIAREMFEVIDDIDGCDGTTIEYNDPYWNLSVEYYKITPELDAYMATLSCPA